MIAVKWRKGKTWANLIPLVRVGFGMMFNLIKNRGVVKSEILVNETEIYNIPSDQYDILKLFGFKGIAQFQTEGSGSVSKEERILGFRCIENQYQFGIHQRIKGVRQNFDPTIVTARFGKWTRIPDIKPVKGLFIPALPFFGGTDNNKDGYGGRAPHDITIYLSFI